MAEVRITVDSAPVSRWLRTIMRDQAPFAMSLAINNTAKQAQAEQRQHQRRIFTVRRPTFVDRAVKIKPFAKKADPFAIIKIEPTGGQKRADILTRHEEDRSRTPEEGRSLAVPREQGAARVIRRKGNPPTPPSGR